ncbi:hypothetical protein AOLI_G00320350 [Acnodon oligacanthus]
MSDWLLCYELKGPSTGKEAPCRPRCLRPDKRRIWQEPRRCIKDTPFAGAAFALPPLLIQGLWGDVRRLQCCGAPELSGYSRSAETTHAATQHLKHYS